METRKEEKKILIANRDTVAGGDNWVLVDDPDGKVYKSLTDTLEAYFQKTGFNKGFYLDPLDSKLYAVDTIEVEVEPEPKKEYSFYFRQGI